MLELIHYSFHTKVVLRVCNGRSRGSLGLGLADPQLSRALSPRTTNCMSNITNFNDGAVPAVLWFTGLSGSGKSTIASIVVRELIRRGIRTEYLDGDAIRLLSPTGFSRADRDVHVKQVGFLASRLEYHGVTVVCALISPYLEARRYVRSLCERFVEIYVATPLAECERRDVKGLYARARRGEICNFTGVDDPYEAPLRPELVIDTSGISVDDAAQRVLVLWDVEKAKSMSNKSSLSASDLALGERAG